MDIHFQWNKPISMITTEATGGKRTLLFMAQEAKRLMTPYVPAKNMVLSSNVRTFVEGDKGITCRLMHTSSMKVMSWCPESQEVLGRKKVKVKL